MSKHRHAPFRNSVDLKDKVQVKILRKRLKLSHEQFASTIRKSGNSISAIIKEASISGLGEPSTDAAGPARLKTIQ